jgi:hypothetical protein
MASNEEKILGPIEAIDKAFEILTSPKNTKGVARDIRNDIVKRTRLGFGVNDAKRQYRLPRLSQSYVNQRKGLLKFVTIKGKSFPIVNNVAKPAARSKPAKKARPKKARPSKPKIARPKKVQPRAPKLSPKTTPGKSNLTATGRLLDSLRFFGQRAKAIVTIPNYRYTTNIFGERLKKGATAQDVVRFQEKKGREFFGLSKSQENRIERKYGTILAELANKLFKQVDS